MLRNTADCEADSDRFIKRVIASESVWYLESEDGVASCESDQFEIEGEPSTVLLFFSDEAYARRVQSAHFPEHNISQMALFDFLYRWLPGMTGDRVLAGPNWNGDLIGLEFEAYPLRIKIEEAMAGNHRERYKAQYENLTRRD
jgi:hypothetical protein